MNEKSKLGSQIAKSGFLNEKIIVSKFLNYMKDYDAQKWLKYMNYDYKKIQKLNALVIPAGTKNIKNLVDNVESFEKFHKFSKADLQVQVEIIINGIIYRENISAKNCKKSASFNQIDKRKVSTYKNMWNMPDEVLEILECFTGAKNPIDLGYSEEQMIVSKNKYRITSRTMKKEHSEKVLNFLNVNKYQILSDIIIGRGPLKADYLIITTDSEHYSISSTCKIVNHFAKYDFSIGTRTTFKLGNFITLQRKGGTPDPESLQFKINPNEVNNIIPEL